MTTIENIKNFQENGAIILRNVLNSGNGKKIVLLPLEFSANDWTGIWLSANQVVR